MSTTSHDTWRLLAHADRLRWFGKHPTTNRLGGGIVASPSALERLLANLADWNLYAHINPIAPDFHGIKAASFQVVEWRYVVIDIDPLDGLEAQPLLASLALRNTYPATLVYTGRGTQLWCELLKPIALSSAAQRQEIERGMAGWLRALRGADHFNCRVDTSCSDLSRVVRLPGSINQKTQQPTAIIHVGTPFDLADSVLACAIPLSEPVPPLPAEETKNLANVIPHLSNAAQRFLTEGAPSGSRHAAAYAAAASLREAGVPLERALNWVCRGGSLCNPPLASPADETDLERATARAYTKP